MSARHARNKPDDEDAATLKLGNGKPHRFWARFRNDLPTSTGVILIVLGFILHPDFTDQACFNISEVYHLLMVQQEQRGAQDNQSVLDIIDMDDPTVPPLTDIRPCLVPGSTRRRSST